VRFGVGKRIVLCTIAAHPRHKNKNVPWVGHPAISSLVYLRVWRLSGGVPDGLRVPGKGLDKYFY